LRATHFVAHNLENHAYAKIGEMEGENRQLGEKLMRVRFSMEDQKIVAAKQKLVIVQHKCIFEKKVRYIFILT
jgi:hypothetical protein